MVKLERILDNDFPINFYEGDRVEWELELLKNERDIKKGKIEKHVFKSSRWKQAKDQLIKETGGRCAYCEVRFNAVAYGDVEHYRPKSIYWWLAYSYDNYLASCQLCNQKYKKDKFPTKNHSLKAPKVFKSYSLSKLKSIAGKLTPNPKNSSQGYHYNDFFSDYFNERPYCINPYYEDPSEYFAYEFDDFLREVKIIPKNNSVKKYVAESEKVYGINRKELREMRYSAFLDYRILKSILNSTKPIDIELRIYSEMAFDLMLKGSKGFLGMINYFENFDIDDIKMVS